MLHAEDWFDLVPLAERMEESLVLLAHHLCLPLCAAVAFGAQRQEKEDTKAREEHPLFFFFALVFLLAALPPPRPPRTYTPPHPTLKKKNHLLFPAQQAYEDCGVKVAAATRQKLANVTRLWVV